MKKDRPKGKTIYLYHLEDPLQKAADAEHRSLTAHIFMILEREVKNAKKPRI